MTIATPVDLMEAISEGMNALHALATGEGEAEAAYLRGLVEALTAMQSGPFANPSPADPGLIAGVEDVLARVEGGTSEGLAAAARACLDVLMARMKP